MTFHDREDELDALDTALESPGHDFYMVYGRRRVGKTEPLKEFCPDRSYIYFLATQEAEDRQREKFVEQVADYSDDRVPRIDGFGVLDYLDEKLATEQLVVVIDELPYLVEENDSLPSYLQSFVDEQLQGPSRCSCCVAPASARWSRRCSVTRVRCTVAAWTNVQSFSFRQVRDVIEYDIEDAIQSFAVTGGTPMYLTLFDYDQPLTENIRITILSPTVILYTEPEFLLRTELRNSARYMSILEAIATGHTTPNEISGATGIDSGPLSKYLQTLRRLRLIDREVPVTASAKQSKRSRYQVVDKFLRFWFRFVEPNRSSIEEAPDVVYEGTIEPELSDHVATTFNDVCREVVRSPCRTSHSGR